MKLKQLMKIPPGYYKDLAMAESSGGKYQRAFKINEKGEKEYVGTASGDYQFIKKTWNETVKEMGENWTEDDRFNSEKSRKAVEFFTQKNEKYLQKKLGKEDINKTELYAAHHFGNYGGYKFLTALQKDNAAPTSSVFSQETLEDNPHLKNLTLGEAYNLLAEKIKDEKKEFNKIPPKEKVNLFRNTQNYPVNNKVVDNTQVNYTQLPEEEKESKKPLTEKDIRKLLEEYTKKNTKQQEKSFLQKYQQTLNPQQEQEYNPQLPQENLDYLYNYIQIED